MLVWENTEEMARASACASGGESLRARYIREGIIKVKASPNHSKVSRHVAAELTNALRVLSISTSRCMAMGGVNSLSQAYRKLLEQRFELVDPKKSEAAPSPWAALVHALNIKQMVWAAVTAVFCKGASAHAAPHGEDHGFFSSSKVDARNAP